MRRGMTTKCRAEACQYKRALSFSAVFVDNIPQTSRRRLLAGFLPACASSSKVGKQE